MPSVKTLDDYHALAASKGVLLLAESVPANILTPVMWACLRCGRALRKSYTKLYYGEHSCRCRAPLALKEADYHALAAKFGLEWIGSEDGFFPQTARHITRWRKKAADASQSQGDDVIEASYAELGYWLPVWLREKLAHV